MSREVIYLIRVAARSEPGRLLNCLVLLYTSAPGSLSAQSKLKAVTVAGMGETEIFPSFFSPLSQLRDANARVCFSSVSQARRGCRKRSGGNKYPTSPRPNTHSPTDDKLTVCF